MRKYLPLGILASLCLSACAVDDPAVATEQQAGINMQGINMQGINMQGINMQGINMQGYRFDGITLSGQALNNLRVERGELVANRANGQGAPLTLRGADLVGARLFAQVADLSVSPPATQLVTYRIASIEAEDPSYDPTATGNTFLYSIEQWVEDDQTWKPACGADSDGRRAAIPLAATWNEYGDRVESSTMFTFGCTTGVIAKCYRWGYRPWVQGYGNLVAMHQTCTRLARADYCGNGVSHTREGTAVNVWDTLPSPGPIQTKAFNLFMVFEAGWNEDGAVCLSHSRWLLDNILGNMCPERLIPPGIGQLTCDTVGEAATNGALMYNESYLNLL